MQRFRPRVIKSASVIRSVRPSSAMVSTTASSVVLRDLPYRSWMGGNVFSAYAYHARRLAKAFKAAGPGTLIGRADCVEKEGQRALGADICGGLDCAIDWRASEQGAGAPPQSRTRSRAASGRSAPACADAQATPRRPSSPTLSSPSPVHIDRLAFNPAHQVQHRVPPATCASARAERAPPRSGKFTIAS